jgi:hypothetical protein
MIAAFAGHAAAIGSLYAMPQARLEEPDLVFRATL